MIEFGPSITVKFICDRGVSHELVRHRLCSFAQESQRYVNYSLEKNGDGDICFIIPSNLNSDVSYKIWENAMIEAEKHYLELIKNNIKPEIARSVLPNSVKTEINVKADLREWRHILKLRTAPDAHPDIRKLCIPLLNKFKELIPIIFDDINISTEN
jgi:thymidylate synthase (FAD)